MMPVWLEHFLVPFIPLFVALDPIGLVPIYLGMAQGTPRGRRNVVINEAIFTALLIAVGFIFLGRFIFDSLSITDNDFRIAGGLILFGLAAQDILGSDQRNADSRTDFGVVPLGMPLIAGPAMLTALLTLTRSAGLPMTLLALLVNLVLVLIALRASTILERLLGLRAMRAFSKIVALLLAAIAVNLVRRGFTTEAPPPSHSSLPISQMRFDVSKFGAVNGGRTLNTQAIQAVIDRCAEQGGGTIVIPAGVFLSGALFLKPSVHLELQAGAVLKGSADINDYPKIMTRIEGHFEPWRAALLNADHADGLRIHGPGTLDGNGTPYWTEFWKQRKINPRVTNLAVERPRLALIQNSDDVQISQVLFKDSGFWNLHLYHSHHLTVDGCRFQATDDPPPNHAASSDGIDVDSCQDVTIRHCAFAVGDDCIALKGSKGPDAMQDVASPPVERILIHDCTFETGGAIVTFGSEATVVRDVKVERCKTLGKVPILRLKLRPDTGQLYENILCRDITGEGSGAIFEVAPWTQFFDLQGQPAPGRTVRNITISGVRGKFGALGRIVGNAGDDISGITLQDVDVTVKKDKLQTRGIRDLNFERVKVNGRWTSVSDTVESPAVSSEPNSPTKPAWDAY